MGERLLFLPILIYLSYVITGANATSDLAATPPPKLLHKRVVYVTWTVWTSYEHACMPTTLLLNLLTVFTNVGVGITATPCATFATIAIVGNYYGCKYTEVAYSPPTTCYPWCVLHISMNRGIGGTTVGSANPYLCGSPTTQYCDTRYIYQDLGDTNPYTGFGCAYQPDFTWVMYRTTTDARGIPPSSRYIDRADLLPANTPSTSSPVNPITTSSSFLSSSSNSASPQTTPTSSASQASQPSDTPTPSPQNGSGSGSGSGGQTNADNTRSDNIALGVGIGIGVPTFIVTVLGVWFGRRRLHLLSPRNTI
jgi:hypothetical protein